MIDRKSIPLLGLPRSDLGASPLSFAPGSMTVFVGPNNAGKSLLLREIENFASSGSHSEHGYRILDRLEFSQWAANDVLTLLRSRRMPPPHGNADPAWTVVQLAVGGGRQHQLNPDEIVTGAIEGRERELHEYAAAALRFLEKLLATLPSRGPRSF